MPLPLTLAPFPWLDLLVILLLVTLNGVLSMSELAIVSARRPRLKAMEKSGRAGATAALKLASDPGRFLSAVQIGITLIGILAGGPALGPARPRAPTGGADRLHPSDLRRHLFVAGDRRIGSQTIRLKIA
jgi:putative hemolysin